MDVWLIVGLGNPGRRYAGNRHNVGHMVLATLAQAHDAKFKSGRNVSVADARLGTLPGGAPGPRAILAMTTTYMNVSGPPIAAISRDIDPERILVIHDDLDLAAHTVRLKRGGGEGGHNGLRSLSQALGTRNFARLRVGIGRPPGRQDAASYVLRDFPAAERQDWAVTIGVAADAASDVVVRGWDKAQLTLHTTE